MVRLFLAICLALGAPAQAFAADYRVAPPPLEPAPRKTFDWSRCYAGLQAGMKIVDNQVFFGRTEFYFADQIRRSSATLTGPVLGGQIGCNTVFANGFLAGVELEGMTGRKRQVECSSQVDPVSQCLELRKRHEAFATVRVGYVVDNSFLCECLNGLMVYGRGGIGYTQTDARMNVNTTSYRYVPGDATGTFFVPQYAQNYDLAGSRGAFAPAIGFGFERAIGTDWTLRVDMTSMVGFNGNVDMSVTQAKLYGQTPESRTPGAVLPPDSTGLFRNPKVGDVLPVKMQEIETRLTVGVNRLF